MFGANGSDLQARSSQDTLRLVADLKVFASYAQAAAFDLCLPPLVEAENAWGITIIELEVLQRAIAGNTIENISKAMAVSEATVNLRIKSVIKKLNCNTQYEAALKAIRNGLIECI